MGCGAWGVECKVYGAGYLPDEDPSTRLLVPRLRPAAFSLSGFRGLTVDVCVGS